VLAVVIPVAGAIVAGIVNHYLALARENRARRVGRSELRARVFADLAARLLSHCSYVQSSIGNGRFEPSAWRPGNEKLHERAEMTDVVEALGKDYVPFMAAIESERRVIDALARLDPGAKTYARRVAQGAFDVVDAYAPFIGDFGEERQAVRLRKIAGDVRKRA
jgi:hypothetical protein